jgi:hypothetical protein
MKIGESETAEAKVTTEAKPMSDADIANIVNVVKHAETVAISMDIPVHQAMEMLLRLSRSFQQLGHGAFPSVAAMKADPTVQ